MKVVYLSLGSNLGNREAMLREAIRRLESPQLRIRRVSSVYETEPRDFRDQPWFLNVVVEAETALFPLQLLGLIRKVELALGRRRLAPKGPRTIDIDILLYGGFVIDTVELAIPHPRMTDRRFVLEPMVELAPELRHPVLRRTMRELLASTLGQAVRRLGPLPAACPPS
jgi:2-amino-4-hydroxy-6-hydroxymethyldihydropteridine diphosphokinase